MEDDADDPLASGLAAGNSRALAALYDRVAGRLYRVAMRLLDCREDAEDAVQEVFVSLVRSRERLPQVRDLDAYLFASLRRAAARRGVQRARLPTASDAGLPEAVARPDGPGGGGLSDDLCRALGGLPAQQREVIALKIDGELTFAEIGQVMGTNANTAASRYRYALEKLRATLTETQAERLR
jgi:RNA polymerase sigma-70 factor (ECF subfamily)